MSSRIFGEIPGVVEGQEFDNRIELSVALVHRPRQAGISGSQKEGADSIVISGGYEDDVDYGDVIIYTGHGGRDHASGKQVLDQELTRQNLALAVNCQRGLPVRVIRGATQNSAHGPESGYRYDGLYRVEHYWRDRGRNGFYVWRFKLVKIYESTEEPRTALLNDALVKEEERGYGKTRRIETVVQRIVRDTEMSRTIKEWYRNKCQVCGTSITTNAGIYSEAAHIKPLGTPHNGPDSLENIICLCPNHHVQFDFGGFAILDNFDLVGEDGRLVVKEQHSIGKEFLKYHRDHIFAERT